MGRLFDVIPEGHEPERNDAFLARLEARIESLERAAKVNEEQRYTRWEKYDEVKDGLQNLWREFEGKLGGLDGKWTARFDLLQKELKAVEMSEAVESVKHSSAWSLLDSKLGWIIAVVIFVLTFFKGPIMDLLTAQDPPPAGMHRRTK